MAEPAKNAAEDGEFLLCLDTAVVFHRLENSPLSYQWGRVNGIAALFGTAPSNTHEAELWFGSHAASASRLAEPFDDSTGGSVTTLAGFLQLATNRARFPEGRLPFLAKLLSIAQPLSLQVHPNGEQALQGFTEEQERLRQGTLSPGQRCYTDPWAKPEAVVALSDDFAAIAGFRDPAVTAKLTAGLASLCEQQGAVEAEKFFIELSHRLKGQSAPTAITAAIDWIFADHGLGGPAQDWFLRQDLDTLSALDASVGDSATAGGMLLALAGVRADASDDRGILLALLCNLYRLRRGESLVMKPGTIHAYLSGSAFELMGASDNVIRAGLTPKHVDRQEFLRVLRIEPGVRQRLQAQSEEGSPHHSVFSSPDIPAVLHHIQSQSEVAGEVAASNSYVAVSLAGEHTLTVGDEQQIITAGEAYFVLPEDFSAKTQLRYRGSGELFLAVQR